MLRPISETSWESPYPSNFTRTYKRHRWKVFPLWVTYLLQFFHRFEHGSTYVVNDVGTFASDDLPNGGFLGAPHGAQCLLKKTHRFLNPLYFTSSCTEDHKHIKFEYGYLRLLSTPSLASLSRLWPMGRIPTEFRDSENEYGYKKLYNHNITFRIRNSDRQSTQRLNIDRWVCGPTLTTSNYGNNVINRNGIL